MLATANRLASQLKLITTQVEVRNPHSVHMKQQKPGSNQHNLTHTWKIPSPKISGRKTIGVLILHLVLEEPIWKNTLVKMGSSAFIYRHQTWPFLKPPQSCEMFFFRFLCAMHFGTCHQRWFGSSHWINIRQLSYILPHQHRTWTLSWFPFESEVLTVDLAGCFYIFIIFPPERNWQGNMAQNHWCVTLNHWIWQDLFSTVHLADLFELAVSDQIQGWDALCLVSLVI